MNGKETQQRQEPESFYKQAPAKLPEVPDLTAKMISQPRGDPFILSSFNTAKH